MGQQQQQQQYQQQQQQQYQQQQQQQYQQQQQQQQQKQQQKQQHQHCRIFCLLVLLCFQGTHSFTDPQDVYALSILFTSLNSPPLAGWGSPTNDPCGELWLGVECAGPNITAIRLPGLGITGWLGFAMENFTGLLTLDLSSNSIGQMVPYQLPPRIQEVNLAYNQLTETLPVSFKELISLISFNISNNQLVGPIPDIFQDLSSLTSLDLSGNHFASALPPSMTSLTSILTLRMQNNQLNGDIHVLGSLQQLQDVDISNNSFSGPIPANMLSIPKFSRAGNPLSAAVTPAPSPYPFISMPPFPAPLSAPRSAPSPSPVTVLRQPNSNKRSPDNPSIKGPVVANITSGRKSYWNPGKIAGVAVVSVLALIAALLIGLFFCGKRTTEEKDEERNSVKSASWHPLVAAEKVSRDMFAQPRATLAPPPSIEKLKPPPPPVEEMKAPSKPPKVQVSVPHFSISELQMATSNFSQDNLVGEGALGRVYRAESEDGKLLAVKKLDASAMNVQNEEEFLRCVAVLARLRHSNLVELIGYCCEHSQRLLVYEFIDHGTLYETLHASGDAGSRLSWNQRVKIALGAARVLEYLHEVCHPPVIHRNFKSANILLDAEGNPQVSDCGLAALFAPFGSERQVSAQMLGSFGYSAPEFAMSGTYTAKSDVYSFGVVMLELLTGRKSLDSSRTRSEQSLVRWATPQLHDIDLLSKMVDPSLKGMYPAISLSRFADVISSCVQPEPEFRPPMSEVVQALVRLMQRATMSNRRLTADDLGSQRTDEW